MQCPTTTRSAQLRAEKFSSTSVIGSRQTLQVRQVARRPAGRTVLKVEDALTRARKDEIIKGVASKLEESMVVFGMSLKGLSVAQMERLRKSFPEDQASIFVCKNSLLLKAAEQVGGWSGLENVTKGSNAFVFAKEEGVAKTVKAWMEFEEEESNALKAILPKNAKFDPPTVLKGGVMEGKYLSEDEIRKLEDMPTKEELMAKIAGMIKGIPTKLGRTIKMVPNKVALGVKAVADLDEENKDKLVGDFAK